MTVKKYKGLRKKMIEAREEKNLALVSLQTNIAARKYEKKKLWTILENQENANKDQVNYIKGQLDELDAAIAENQAVIKRKSTYVKYLLSRMSNNK